MSRTDVEIRELGAADVDRVRDLWGALTEHHQQIAIQLNDLGRRLTIEESWEFRRAQYLEWFETGRGRLWVAQRSTTTGEEPIGYCFVHLGAGSISWDWGSSVGVLETLVVTEGARGLGLGTQLLDLAKAYFVENDARILKVSVIAGNDDALRLYRRLGAIDQLITLVMPLTRSGRTDEEMDIEGVGE